MIHLIKLEAPCEICAKVITFECVWFDKPEEDAEYAGSYVGDKGEDKIGVKVTKKDGVPEELVDKWIICQTHRPNGMKKGDLCPVSYRIPENLDILKSLAEKVLTEGNPHPKPVENQIAHKTDGEKGPQPLKKNLKRKSTQRNG